MMIAVGCFRDESFALDALDSLLAHQSGHAVMAAFDSLFMKRLGDFWAAIERSMVLVDLFDFGGQLLILGLALARAGLGAAPGVEPAAGDSKKVAERPDFELSAHGLNEGILFGRFCSESMPKAFFKIS